MKYIFIIILISVNIIADMSKNEKFVKFETGSSFVFIQIDKANDIFSIISELNAPIKHNGAYCYLPDDIYDTISFEKISEKYCKDTPPYQNISKEFQTVMNDLVVYPRKDTGIKPFIVNENNVSDEMLQFFYQYAVVSNRTQELNETFTVNNNFIELKVTGKGSSNIGLCGAVPANIVDLKINGHQFFDSLYMQNCYGNDIKRIKINLKKRLITIYAYDDNAEIFSFNLPFKYFKKAVSSLADERTMYMQIK